MRRKNLKFLLSPVVIFSALWGAQIFGQIFLSKDFYAFDNKTWRLIGIGMVSFYFGCTFASMLKFRRHRNIKYINNEFRVMAKLCFYLLFAVYIYVAIIPTINLIGRASTMAEFRSLMVERIVNYDFEAVLASYLTIWLVVYAVYLISHAEYFSGRFLFFAFSVAAIASFLSSGRTLLLLLLISMPASLYLKDKIRLKSFLASLVIFLFSFFFLAIIYDKGAGQFGSVSDKIIWNIETYFFNGIADFNYFVANGFPRFDSYLLVPNLLRKIFELGGSIPTIMPFVETPIPGNVYTSLYPWYHDLGSAGVVLGFLFIGFFSQILYVRRNISSRNIYYYAVSLYALIMTVFQDQYIQAYPMWVIIFLAPKMPSVFAKVIFFLNLKENSGRAHKRDGVHSSCG